MGRIILKKCWPQFFQAVKTGLKLFDVRLNDESYELGDTYVQQEYDPETKLYSGDEVARQITFVVPLKIDIKTTDFDVLAWIEFLLGNFKFWTAEEIAKYGLVVIGLAPHPEELKKDAEMLQHADEIAKWWQARFAAGETGFNPQGAGDVIGALVEQDYWNIFFCPSCNVKLDEFRFCPKCGECYAAGDDEDLEESHDEAAEIESIVQLTRRHVKWTCNYCQGGNDSNLAFSHISELAECTPSHDDPKHEDYHLHLECGNCGKMCDIILNEELAKELDDVRK